MVGAEMVVRLVGVVVLGCWARCKRWMEPGHSFTTKVLLSTHSNHFQLLRNLALASAKWVEAKNDVLKKEHYGYGCRH